MEVPMKVEVEHVVEIETDPADLLCKFGILSRPDGSAVFTQSKSFIRCSKRCKLGKSKDLPHAHNYADDVIILLPHFVLGTCRLTQHVYLNTSGVYKYMHENQY